MITLTAPEYALARFQRSKCWSGLPGSVGQCYLFPPYQETKASIRRITFSPSVLDNIIASIFRVLNCHGHIRRCGTMLSLHQRAVFLPLIVLLLTGYAYILDDYFSEAQEVHRLVSCGQICTLLRISTVLKLLAVRTNQSGRQVAIFKAAATPLPLHLWVWQQTEQ